MGDIQPVFVLSVQRSGSTLLQRMLAAHPEIATVSEPWVLLPLLYSMRPAGVYAEYGHAMAVAAIEDFAGTLPDGMDGYRHELRSMALHLYREAAGPGPGFFVDKTPRYALAIDELMATFPDGRFVVLFRNPLAVVASIIETWAHGAWNLDAAKVDIYDGLLRLVAGYERHQERVHALRYEDLLTDTTTTLRALFEHIGVESRDDVVDQFIATRLEGRMGDPERAGYTELSREPLDKWRATLDNHFRKLWAQRYLSIIGRERLAVMGYEIDELRRQLEAIPATSHRLGNDLIAVGRGVIHSALETRIIRHKLQHLPAWHEIHRHS